MSHTKGIWETKENGFNHTAVVVVTDEVENWLTYEAGNRSNCDEQVANARLIAASPDMLEALIHAEAILSCADQFTTNKGGCGPQTNTHKARDMVRAAIAKAAGEDK